MLVVGIILAIVGVILGIVAFKTDTDLLGVPCVLALLFGICLIVTGAK